MEPLAINNSPEIIAARTAGIHEAMLRESRHIREANFAFIGTEDLARLFRLYDEQFSEGWMTRAVAEQAAGPVIFRLSSTMTRSGGKTVQHRYREASGHTHVHFEIAIASRMLFMTFGDIDRPVIVCGVVCRDRLEALQRIMEHEIVHLVEVLLWGKSNCAMDSFKALAGRIFGHTQSAHGLVTPRERAAVELGIKVGDWVQFEFEGVRYVGRVNRIHRRATVLVPSDHGMPYSDGKIYEKFYIPLEMLTSAPGPTPRG